jgi:hypothetical protein
MQPGSLIGFAHFAWNVSWNITNETKGFPWFVTTGDIDFVELLQFLKLNTLDYYEYLNLGFKITAAAGSDFPWASTIGEVRTLVYTGDKFNPDAWFAGLKAGHTFVSNGPALFFSVDGKLPGEEIARKSGSSVKLSVQASSRPEIGAIKKIAIYNNEGLVAEKDNITNQNTIEINLTHKLKRSQWIAAVVNCENGAVAHTTPVYVVVDNKPTYDLNKAPAIIQKQVSSINDLIKEESSKAVLDHGILERLKTANSFYEILLNQINAEKESSLKK